MASVAARDRPRSSRINFQMYVGRPRPPHPRSPVGCSAWGTEAAHHPCPVEGAPAGDCASCRFGRRLFLPQEIQHGTLPPRSGRPTRLPRLLRPWRCVAALTRTLVSTRRPTASRAAFARARMAQDGLHRDPSVAGDGRGVINRAGCHELLCGIHDVLRGLLRADGSTAHVVGALRCRPHS